MDKGDPVARKASDDVESFIAILKQDASHAGRRAAIINHSNENFG